MIKTKIAIVDDHVILLEGIKRMLSDMKDMEVVIEASNGKEFLKRLETITPDLAIVDINMPEMCGDEAVRLAKLKLPDLKVIILSMISSEDYFNIFNNLGVDGYLLKDSEYDEFYRAIKVVLNGGKYFSQELLVSLLQQKNPEISISLTKREKDVLKLLCSGFSTKEIADKLFLSQRTVDKYRSGLLVKTGVSNSISLVLYAFKNALVQVTK